MPKFKCCNSAQLAAIFFLLAVVLAHIGHRVTERHITLLELRTQGLFATLIPLERQRIAAWRREREADINHYARSPAAAAALGPVLERPNDSEARRRASDWFARMRAVHPEYTGVTLAGPAGSVALRLGAAPPHPTTAGAFKRWSPEPAIGAT